ncbi:SGNH/GDSL hydrolase family protein [Mucilaginibacter sp. UYCu711]|uniref:SGNH/GDSL hydrolase family protein n=1 Tax=Mucilaginibacter sp. UYCu711 TaxID=3156339 RepID=UPI003D205C60
MRSKIAFIALSIFISTACVAQTKAKPKADTPYISGKPLDTMKIVYFGSSVPYGFGAKKDYGYTYLFTDILKKRAADGTGKTWKTANISRGGDNTIRLTQRWRKDLVPQKAKYVVYALSLGNEMLHEQGPSKYTQFKTNMLKLIAMARDSGYVPIVTNAYTRNDFNERDYHYTKELNMWINSLDVPSINLLGGVDDGTGKWAPGNWYNPGHPNDAGHLELAYTIVPSLFDALSNGKPLPKMVESSGITLGKTGLIDFKPDNITHPFTTTITIKANGKGQILQLLDSTAHAGSIVITDKGTVEYTSPQYQQITGTTRITDGQWHKITLTHYYARNETQLYCDSTLQGHVAERLFIKHLQLGNKNGNGISAKNWLFYRSGMNSIEIAALTNNVFLQSSMELYAPLDEKRGVLDNLAQSTVGLKWVK